MPPLDAYMVLATALAVAAAAGGVWLAKRGRNPAAARQRHHQRPALGVRVVCLSDTHGQHRKVEVPLGDILIHAGDFTHFGKRRDLDDFAEWLGEQPHAVKLVVNGNHEHNAEWKTHTAEVLAAAGARFLLQDAARVTVRGAAVNIFGTQFFWPCPTGNPNFASIPADTHIVVAHGPADGHVDGGHGCVSLAAYLAKLPDLRLVVSGHIHEAHGVETTAGGTVYVNAAICRGGYRPGWPAEVVDL